MFESTKKAFGKAPHLLGNHHKKDPEIEIWTKDFAAAKVAMNTLDREIKESQASVSNFVKVSLELYNAFVSILTCDSSVPATHKIPDNPNVFAPLQEIVGKVESIAHTHSHKVDGYIKEIRHLMSSVEDLLKNTDHKKAECDRFVEHNQIDYDDPKSAETPQVQEYLKYHYHMLSLVPQVIKNLDKLIQLLIEKQLGYQLEAFGLVRDAIKKVEIATNTPQAKDNVEILQKWSTEIEPVVAKLAKTKTVGSFAVAPPPPNTWDRAQHVPHQVVSSIPSVEQTKNFATGVGGSFKYGLSYIYPMDVKFFNPQKGMFGEITDGDRKTAEAGKEVGATDSPAPETPTAAGSSFSGSAVPASPTLTDAPQAVPVTNVIPPPVQPLETSTQKSAEHPTHTTDQPTVTRTTDPLPTPTPTQPLGSPGPTTATPAQPVAREAPPSAQVTQTTSPPSSAPAPVVTAAPIAQEPPKTSTTAAKFDDHGVPSLKTPGGRNNAPVTEHVPITSPGDSSIAPSSAIPEPVQPPSGHPPATASTTQATFTPAPTAAPTAASTTSVPASSTSVPARNSNSDDELL